MFVGEILLLEILLFWYNNSIVMSNHSLPRREGEGRVFYFFAFDAVPTCDLTQRKPTKERPTF